MIVLLGIAFVAGLVTAFTPCILPVLPIVLAGGASGGRRKPYAIVTGLVASFTLFTLAATWLLDLLHLRHDLLRDIAIGMLFLLAATLLVPRLAELLERPFLFLTRRRAGDLGGGFLLGVSLGLVFVPCAGPVLAAVTLLAGTHRVSGEAVAVTFVYAIGAAIPLLLVAAGGRRVSSTFRARGNAIRVAMGVLMAVGAFAILENWDQSLQTKLGGYTTSIQNWIEGSSAADRRLAELRGGDSNAIGQGSSGLLAAKLDDFGAGPEFTGIEKWLNTPGGRPLTLAGLRGKVVLVDFWTYSCINCLRTLPHLEAWDRAYRKAGLVIVGVHTPEFAFEHVVSNVRGASRRLGVRYPVAIDNRYGTWEAYGNQYWPAEYLIDRKGHVRHAHFGEGEYDKTESLIRRLLATDMTTLAAAAKAPDTTPDGLLTPESYLGYERLDRYVGSTLAHDREASYRFPKRVGPNELAYDGRWRVEGERIVAGRDARLRLHYQARDVYLVLGGHGRLRTLLDGKTTRTLAVNGDRLYTLVSDPEEHDKLLELRFTPGISAYAFTFG
jgi:cytochrome c biogenesis protein CcdA/thiol-disulfide isomerase/thioredoxin